MSNELLTVPEAALLLRTTPQGVYTLISRGTMPGVTRMGKRVLIRAADLRKHLGLTTVPPTPYSSLPGGTGSEKGL